MTKLKQQSGTLLNEQDSAILNEISAYSLSDWDDLNLPPKELIYNFNDGNTHKIIFKKSSTAYSMLTFTLEEDGIVYFGNGSYGHWYFSPREALVDSKVNFYSLTKTSISSATSYGFNSSSVNYLSTSTQMYNKDYSNVIFSTIDIYRKDTTTLAVAKNSMDDIHPLKPTIRSVGLDPNVRIKVGEEWKSKLVLDATFPEGSTFKEFVFIEDYPDTFDSRQSVLIQTQVSTNELGLLSSIYTFNLNIHEDDSTLNYSNRIPFPPQDGMKTFVAFQGRTDIELLSFTATEGVYGYFSSATYFTWSYKHTDGGYDSCSGTYSYKLDENNQWVLQANKQTSPSPTPSGGSYVLTDYNDVFFTNVDIYDSSSKTNVLIKGQYYPREEYSIKKRPFEPPFELPSVKEILTEDQAQHYFMMYNKSDICLVTIIPEVLEDFHLYQQGGNSTYLYPSCRMTSIKYRRLNQTTMVWNSPSSYKNQTSFNSSFVHPGYSSTLNGAKTLNDMIIYTTAPVYLKRSAGTAPMTLVRKADNQLIVDENSIAPIVTDVLFGIEAPYTVDSEFTFDPIYQLEELDGVLFGGAEWENTMSYYPSGEHTISARVKDSRGLWSEWFDKTFTIEPVILPTTIDITNLPTKPNAEPYQHYLVAKYSSGTTASSYFCFAFDLKADVASFTPYMRHNSNYFNFNAYAKDLFETAHYYEGYNQNTGWGSGSYKEIAMTYTHLSIGSTSRYVYNSLASNVFLSTFPIYTDSDSSTIRAFPVNESQFPLNIVAAASHQNVWTSDDVKVSYNVVLNGQTLKNVSYRINGGECIALDSNDLSGEIIFNQTGDYHVEVIATNTEGYESVSEVFFKIDKTTPVLNIEETSTELIFTAIDEHAGIESIYYRLAEADVFTRSQNFAHHLAIALNEASEESAMSKNSWIKINSGFKLKKPVYGGIYTYELMATDKVGNTHMVQYVYDLPKIPFQEIVVSPNPVDLTYRSNATLKVSYLPENHNEEIKLMFESLNPDYVSVNQNGYVQNIDAYYEGETIVRVSSNNVSTDVIVNSVINRVEYPKNYPSLYDIHHYTHEFSDFMIAKDRHYGHFYLYAFNREENDAIFYLTTRNTLFHHLGYSIPNTVSEAKYFTKLNENQWNREGTVIRVAEDMLDERYLSSKNPHESVVFSTVDLHLDASGERLIRPKDELPPSIRASVRLEPDYFGGWVTASYFKVVGDDLGDGLTKLTYSINSEKEVEIENGGIICFPSSGVHTVQAFAYNNHNVRSETELLTVEIDFDAPVVSIEKEYNRSTDCYDIYVVATDTVSSLYSIRFHKNGEAFDDLYFKGDTETRTLIDRHSIREYGTFNYDIFVSDVAGNETYVPYELEVEKPVPSGITVNPASVSIREGEVITLDVQVDIVGDLQEGEITLGGYDDFVIDVNGFEVMGLTSGFTTIIVSCRGVSTSVPVYVSPAFIPVESLEVRPTEATLEIGETIQLETIITPHEATDRTLTFHSTHSDIVSVDEEGVVCALTQGQAEVIVSTHNNIEQRVSITVLKPKEAPVVSNLTIQPSSPYVGQKVLFTYDLWLDDERGAKLVEERWTGKQDAYSEAGAYTVGLEVLDSNGLWSEKIEITFEVRPASNIRVKLNDRFVSLARSVEPTPVRFKASNGWCYLQTTNNPSPVRVKLNGEWVSIQIEE